jgi:hypothetical protein
MWFGDENRKPSNQAVDKPVSSAKEAAKLHDKIVEENIIAPEKDPEREQEHSIMSKVTESLRTAAEKVNEAGHNFGDKIKEIIHPHESDGRAHEAIHIEHGNIPDRAISHDPIYDGSQDPVGCSIVDEEDED